MTITKLLLVCICCLIAALAVWGQAVNSPANPGVLGYLDPHTGAFRPVPQATEEDAVLAPTTTFTGTITVTLTITLKTTSLTNITCTASVFVTDAASTGSPVSLLDGAAVAATGTGMTRTCKLTIPYAWSLTTQSSDIMTTDYSLVGGAGAIIGTPQRSNSRLPLDRRKVPASGAITALTAAVTL